VDPTAGLDPAVREITSTRLFAERSLFTTQRMPFLLRFQAELLGRQLASQPEVQLAMKSHHPIRALCQALEVSPSGYYDWHNRQTQPGPRARENAQLLVHIIRFHKDSRETYGSPRIQVLLRRAGHSHGRNRIARLMRQQGLSGRAKGRFRVSG
jgi:hypothetical protein